MLVQYGPDYDRSGSDYLQQVVENFPADMLTRAYASAIRVIELPYHQKLMLPQKEFLHIPHWLLVDPRSFSARAGAGLAADRRGGTVRADGDERAHRPVRHCCWCSTCRPTPRCSSASGTIFISNSSGGGRWVLSCR